MGDFENILQQVYLGNTVRDYLWVVGSLLVGFIFLRFLAHRVSDLLFRLVSKATNAINKDALYNLIGAPLRWFIMLMVLFVCTSHLEYPAEWNLAPRSEWGVKMVVYRTYLLFLCVVITWILMRMASFIGIILVARAELTESKADDQIIPFMVEMVKIIIVVIAIFAILGTVFKVDIAALIAGLGVGGLALALAAKESLENLLASFMIFFDKPFTVGDLVSINGNVGTVDKIGFRSTRLRTLEKSYLTIPNLLMVNNVLDNLSLRTFRRASFNIGLLYSTTQEQLHAVVNDIQKLVDEHPNTNQDGEIHFVEFGASSLDIMVLYFVDTMDWSVYLRIKEEINFKIIAIVKNHGTDFAFPTQTIHLEKS